jgi:hypothetical protein
MLNGKQIIDSAMTHTQDNSVTLRVRMLSWLNTAFQQAFLERDWLALELSETSITITDNTITKTAATYGKFRFAQQFSSDTQSGFVLQKNDRLSVQERFDLEEDTTSTDDRKAIGFFEDSTKIYFRYGALGILNELAYYRLVPIVADNTDDTVWPEYFLPLFERTLLSAYYEFDVDDRLIVSVQLDAEEVSRIKKWENTQNPTPRNSTQGYLRDKR